MTRVLALVTARGGSKGLPGKNILPLAGKPMIGWTIEAALGCASVDRVVVSTDDAAIADVAREFGAGVPFERPAALATDTADHMAVVVHALEWLDANEDYRPDYLLLLQPTSPLRREEDIGGAIQLAEKQSAESVVSVCAVSDHPYWTKRILDDGRLADFVVSDLDYPRRQDLPPAYILNGAIFLSRRETLLTQRQFITAQTLAYVMPAERSFDVDTRWDFYLADLILRHPYATNG